MSTEKTPLTGPGSREGRIPYPNYIYRSHEFQARRVRENQFQCLWFAVSLALFIMALVMTVSYSVNQAIKDDNAMPIEDSPNLLQSVWNLPPSISSTITDQPPGLLSDDEWTDCYTAGQQAIDNRQKADAQATPLSSPTPNSRHQFAISTTVFAGKLALAGVGEIAATQKIENDRLLRGKPSAIGSYFNGGWAPDGSCKELVDIPCPTSKYRSIDGTCNNERQWGSSLTPFRRALPPDYSDGINAPRKGKYGNSLPSAREVSLRVHPPSPSSNPSFTVMLAVFGQFLDHDITATAVSQGKNGSSLSCCPPTPGHPECFPVAVGPGDPVYDVAGSSCMEFVRSAPAPQCKLGPRQQLNQVSAFIDGSAIYGPDFSTAQDLREGEGGRLKMQTTADNRTLLPPSTNLNDGCNRASENLRGRYCFASGDARANENLHLTTMHLIWARQHNKVADNLAELHPTWDDEKVYQETRRLVAAQLQHITYNEFLPIVLGETATVAHDLKPLNSGFRDAYDPRLNPAIGNNFAAAAFRFAHTLLPGLMRVANAEKGTQSWIELHKMLFNPFSLYAKGGVESSVTSATSNAIQRMSTHVTSQLTRRLFEDPTANTSVPCGLDLVSLNIQRGRDHGLPSYTAWREYCGLSRPLKFSDLDGDLDPDALEQISALYATVDDVDLYTGALAEIPKSDGLLGPTFTCLIAEQFVRLGRGDRFWYETPAQPQAFTEEQLREIRKTSLAKVICDCSDGVTQIQPEVMRSVGADNAIMPCEDIAGPSMEAWREDDYPKLNLAPDTADEDWLTFKDEIKQSIQDIVVYINVTKPPAGDPTWVDFRNYVNSSFADFRNQIAKLHPQPTAGEDQEDLQGNLKSEEGERDIGGLLKKSLAETNDYVLQLAAEPAVFEDWVNFRKEINKSLSDAVKNIRGNLPPPGDSEWVTFGDMVKSEFVDIKNQIINTVIKPKPLLGKAADNGTFDWADFESEFNKSLSDAINNVKGNLPLPGDPGWATFGDKVKGPFTDLKNKILHTVVKPKPLLGESAKNGTFDWASFESQFNKSLSDAINNVKGNLPLPGDTTGWASYADTVKSQFTDLKNKIINNVKPKPFLGKSAGNSTFDWLAFKTEINKSLSDAVRKVKGDLPAPGDPEWAAFGDMIEDQFAGIKKKILNTVVQPKPLLGKSAGNSTFDWTDFESEFNKSLDDAINNINNSLPLPGDPTGWVTFADKIKGPFMDLKKKILNNVKPKPLLGKFAGNGTFDWVNFESEFNKSLSDAIKNVKGNYPLPDDKSGWATFGDKVKGPFIDLKNKIKPQPFLGESAEISTFDWADFEGEFNKSLSDAINNMKGNLPLPGDISGWAAFGDKVKGPFMDLKKKFLKPKPVLGKTAGNSTFDWASFESDFNKSLSDAISSIKNNLPAPGGPGWVTYGDMVKAQFADLKNKILANTVKPKPSLGKSAENSTFDWVDFKTEFNKSLTDAINKISSNLPSPGDPGWVSYADMVKGEFAELKKNILDYIKPKPVLGKSAANSTFDWVDFKIEINKTVSDIVDNIKSNALTPGDPEWLSFRDYVNKSFSAIRSNIADLQPKPNKKVLLTLTNDWLDFKTAINKSVTDAISAMKKNKPLPGDPSWATFGASIGTQFAEIRNEIAAIKPVPFLAKASADPNQAYLLDLKNELNKIKNFTADINAKRNLLNGTDWIDLRTDLNKTFSVIKSNIAKLKPTLTSAVIPQTDWVAFKQQINATIMNYIIGMNHSDPAEWTNFKAFVNGSFAVIRQNLATLRNITSSKLAISEKLGTFLSDEVLGGDSDSSFDLTTVKYEDSVVTDEVVGGEPDSSPETTTSKFDWMKFKTKANQSVDFASMYKNKPPPGDPAWASFGKSYWGTKLQSAGFESSSLTKATTTNWTAYGNEVSETMSRIGEGMVALEQLSGNLDLGEYKEYVDEALGDLQKTIQKTREEIAESSSVFLHGQHCLTGTFALATITVYFMY